MAEISFRMAVKASPREAGLALSGIQQCARCRCAIAFANRLGQPINKKVRHARKERLGFFIFLNLLFFYFYTNLKMCD